VRVRGRHAGEGVITEGAYWQRAAPSTRGLLECVE